MNEYCWSDRHGEPCHLPCQACHDECDGADYADTEVNRRRTAEWVTRQAVHDIADDNKRQNDYWQRVGGHPDAGEVDSE